MMNHFIVENGKIKELTEEEFVGLQGRDVNEVVKDMPPEELKAFKKERYKKFLKPLMGYNISELSKKK